GFGPPDEVTDACAQLRDNHGIKSFKVKVGQGLDRDIAVLRSLRREQPDARISVDANGAYDLVEARRLVRALAELDIAWIEEPLSADRPLGRVRIAASAEILGDESCSTPGEVAREVLAGRSHLVSLKPARTGYLLSDRIRGFCESSGVPLVVGTQGESGIGTL